MQTQIQIRAFLFKDMENKEELIEQAQKDIDDLAFQIEYHRKKIDEYTLRMNLAQFALIELEKK